MRMNEYIYFIGYLLLVEILVGNGIAKTFGTAFSSSSINTLSTAITSSRARARTHTHTHTHIFAATGSGLQFVRLGHHHLRSFVSEVCPDRRLIKEHKLSSTPKQFEGKRNPKPTLATAASRSQTPSKSLRTDVRTQDRPFPASRKIHFPKNTCLSKKRWDSMPGMTRLSLS
jgi:hypothetical protein